MDAIEFAVKVRKLAKRCGGKIPDALRDELRDLAEADRGKFIATLTKAADIIEAADKARRAAIKSRKAKDKAKPSALRRKQKQAKAAGSKPTNGPANGAGSDG